MEALTGVSTPSPPAVCVHRPLPSEKREAIEAERGARRRAEDREAAARAERKAKSSARKEVQRRRAALDKLEEAAR